jgi:hypothetical protein
MLRYLTHAGLLGQVRVVSSVSGGSIANGWRRARSISIATAPPAARGEPDNSLGSHIDQSDHVTRPGATTL